MVQNSNDIYKLIKSPTYVAEYHITDKPITSYNLHNKIAPFERIRVEIHDKSMEIYKYNHMSYEYYENIHTTNQYGQKMLNRFKDLLFTKRIASMIQHIDENYR